MFDIEQIKSITNPSTLETIHQLKSMFDKLAEAAIDGRPIIVVSSTDERDKFLRQHAIDNAPDGEMRNHFLNYTIQALLA